MKSRKNVIFMIFILFLSFFIGIQTVNADDKYNICKNQCGGKTPTLYQDCFNSCYNSGSDKENKTSATENNNDTKEDTSSSTTTDDNNKTSTTKKNNRTKSTSSSKECNALLGDKKNTESVAWLVQKLLDYLKILGPILVVILSSVDFATAIVSGNDDTMKKAQKKLITRLIAAVLLFLIPTVVQILLDVFGMTSCTIY